MKYSNKRKDFFRNKHYRLYVLSKNFSDTLDMFLNIANEIGMPEKIALDEAVLFAQSKSHRNCLIVTILFGSPNKANRYVQSLNKTTFNILEDFMKNFSILELPRKFKSYSGTK